MAFDAGARPCDTLVRDHVRHDTRSSPPPPAKQRILIVDDHALMRRGLAALIDNEPDLIVCGEAATRRT